MLVALQNITFEFGARVIVEEATWHIMPGERIGLIGLNGTGKSTLLRIINGEYAVSAGTVEKSKNMTIGFFNQDMLSFETDQPIIEVAMQAFEKALQLEKDIHHITQQLVHTQQEVLLHEYSDKLHEFETLDGYNIRPKAAAILEGLGFTTSDLERPYQEFSGGWRMRVLLAKLLLQEPSLLMLDEPTNHLDLPSIEWLERYLEHYNGTVIIVSHDRYFLDRMVTKIVELYQLQLHSYNGNYSFFEKEKNIRRELQQRAFENQQEYIRQQERFIERFRAKATKAAQAQSVIKRLEKLERIEEVQNEASKININFNVNVIPGKIICTLKNVSKNFGDTLILKNASLEINRGDKIGLIGANGKGKSTLLRIINGTETFQGERIPGHNVVTSFYAQHQLEALNLEHDILEEMKSCGSGKNEQELRSLLGCFLFGSDDVFKKIRILSGGEKARVALVKTIISQANFLLLDEPTNHLDIYSLQMLIEALRKYEGSYVLVSHDRHFVNKTVNKIWEIEDGVIQSFDGNFDEWEAWKKRKTFSQSGIKNEDAPTQNSLTEPTIENSLSNNNSKTAINKEIKKELQKQQKQFKELEDKINELNEKKRQLEDQLATPALYADKTKFLECEKAYSQINVQLENAHAHYEKLFNSILLLEQQLFQ